MALLTQGPLPRGHGDFGSQQPHANRSTLYQENFKIILTIIFRLSACCIDRTKDCVGFVHVELSAFVKLVDSVVFCVHISAN